MSDQFDTEELRESIRSVLSDRGGGAIPIPDEEGFGFDAELWGEMAALGWLSLPVPEKHGGLGLGAPHLAVLYEELGRQVSSVPIMETMAAALAIARHGTPEMRARWLPAIATGECRAAIAPPHNGVSASLDSSGRISGSFEHVAFAPDATLLLVPLRRADAAGLDLLLLPTDRPGVVITARPVVDLTRRMGRVDLDAVEDADRSLPMTSGDWDALADHLAMGVACDAIGGAAALLDRTVDYLKIREQFGRPIGSFQALKHRAADWKVKIEAATALARHSAALLESGNGDAAVTVSEAKAYACDVYAAFAGDAVQLHGGIGFTWEHPCHLFLKRAKLGQQLYGSSASHKDRAARLAFNDDDQEVSGTATPRLETP